MHATLKVWFSLVLTLVMLFTAACSQHTAPSHKSVTLLFSFPTNTLDPHLDTNYTAVRAGIAETLLKLDDDLQVAPWLATDWERIDGRTWRFVLRDDVTFHDGTPLSAEKAKESLERAVQESKAVASALKIESIQADGYTLTLHTREEHPDLPSELVYPNTAVIKTDSDIAHAPIGTGPFRVQSFQSNEKVHVKRFDEYWKGPSPLDEAFFTFNADPNVRSLSFQSGEADIVYHLAAESLAPIEDNKRLDVVSIPSLRAHFLLYNAQKEHFQDRRIRQAMDLLIDRESMAKNIMGDHATPANGPFHPQFPFSTPEHKTSFAPEKAEKLLEQAGWKRNKEGRLEKNGQPFKLNLVTYQGRPELPLMAQLFQAEAKKVGIDVQIQTVDNIDSHLAEKEDWDLATYSNLTAPRGEGSYFLNVAYLPDGALNPGHIDIPQLNKTIQKLNATHEPDKRVALTRQAVDIINREVPQSFLVYPHIIVGVHQRVTNWKPGPEEYYMLTHELDVK